MGKEKEFKQHLEKKYGEEITKRLYNDGKIQTNFIKRKNKEDQNLIKNHLRDNIINENIKFDIVDEYHEKDNNWAFDFPGWTGTIDFSKTNLKKYMVIGLEPHIEIFDFQITYGLSDYTNNYKDESTVLPDGIVSRFSIIQNENNYIGSIDDSGIIWSNLFKLFADDITINEVKNNNNKLELDKFLNQFYIADLCHFAPQGKANQIKKIKNWNKIREKIAEQFLKKEIEILNPEVIIIQGIGVFNVITKMLGVSSNKKVLFEEPYSEKINWKIRGADYNNIKIICLPHIGSQMTYNTFWHKSILSVSKKLNEYLTQK